jgi:hypothetical protein
MKEGRRMGVIKRVVEILKVAIMTLLFGPGYRLGERRR